jgi:hypothetical protein
MNKLDTTGWSEDKKEAYQQYLAKIQLEKELEKELEKIVEAQNLHKKYYETRPKGGLG